MKVDRRKIVHMILIVLLMTAVLLLAACRKEANDPVVFDRFPLYAEYDAEEAHEFTIDDFPGVTFSYDEITVYSPEGEALIKGYIMGLYRYDVTGDGKKDICTMIEQGSGNITLTACVYDWANKTYYEMKYRGGSHRFLFTKDNELLAGNFKVKDLKEFEIAEAGKLVIKDGELTIEPDDALIPAAAEVFERSKWAAYYSEYRTRRLEILEELYPSYFGLDASNGLTVYLNSSEQYGILAGKDGVLEFEDYNMNYLKYNKYGGPSFAEIRAILGSYDITEDQVSFKPFYDPGANYITKGLTLEAIQRLFSNRTGGAYTLGSWLMTSGFQEEEDKRSENRQPSRAMEEEVIESWYRRTDTGEADHLGQCWKTFDIWKEAIDYLGFEVQDPLEDLNWLENTDVAAADAEPEQLEGLNHAYLCWCGTYDGKINYYLLGAGYMTGDVRVTLLISTDLVYQEFYRHDRFTKEWHASDLWFGKDGYQYRVTVTSFEGPAARDEVVDKILKVFDISEE